jgi:hypothetical protein
MARAAELSAWATILKPFQKHLAQQRACRQCLYEALAHRHKLGLSAAQGPGGLRLAPSAERVSADLQRSAARAPPCPWALCPVKVTKHIELIPSSRVLLGARAVIHGASHVLHQEFHLMHVEPGWLRKVTRTLFRRVFGVCPVLCREQQLADRRAVKFASLLVENLLVSGRREIVDGRPKSGSARPPPTWLGCAASGDKPRRARKNLDAMTLLAPPGVAPREYSSVR